MKNPKALAIILGGYLAIALFLQNALSAHPPEKQTMEQKTEQTKLLTRDEKQKEKEEKFAGYSRHIKTNYYSILKSIQETSADYVSGARQISSDLENSIKKYGIKEIVGIRDQADISCLDLALERINQKMPENEFDKKTKQISKEFYEGLQRTNISSPIDFTREIIIQADQKDTILTVLFYERLLNSKPKVNPERTNPAPDYEELVESAFSEKEYLEVVLKKISILDDIYDAFLKSRVGFRGLFASSEINKMRKFTKEHYKERGEKIYPTGASEKMLKNKDG